MKGNLNDLTTPGLRERLGVQVNGAPPGTSPGLPLTDRPMAPKPLPADAVTLGMDDRSNLFGISLSGLLAGRLLVQGNSGAGKSWTLRKLLEQSAARVQQIILDPEGEFLTLAETFDYPIAEAHRMDLSGAIQLAQRVRELRQSIVVDLSELERDRQMMFVATFLTALIDAPQDDWHSAIVAIDEAHLFAPLGGQGFEGPMVRKRSVSAIVDLMSRGRKRGLAGVLATQRFARLSKSVASEVMNFLIGINTLDLDIRRAAETIGWDARRAFDRLPLLQQGEFVAVGPAFVASPVVVHIGSVRSRHVGGTPAIAGPAVRGAAAAAELLDLDGLEADVIADRDLPIGAKAVREFLRDPGSQLAAAIFAEVRPLYPEGTTAASLAKHFDATLRQVAAALALLSSVGAVDTLGSGPELAVRMHRSMIQAK